METETPSVKETKSTDTLPIDPKKVQEALDAQTIELSPEESARVQAYLGGQAEVFDELSEEGKAELKRRRREKAEGAVRDAPIIALEREMRDSPPSQYSPEAAQTLERLLEEELVIKTEELEPLPDSHEEVEEISSEDLGLVPIDEDQPDSLVKPETERVQVEPKISSTERRVAIERKLIIDIFQGSSSLYARAPEIRGHRAFVVNGWQLTDVVIDPLDSKQSRVKLERPAGKDDLMETTMGLTEFVGYNKKFLDEYAKKQKQRK